MRSTVLRFGSVLAILALVLAACGGQRASRRLRPGASRQPPARRAAPASRSRSAGSAAWARAMTPAQVPTEEAVVDAFNESHDDIELVLEIVDYDSAFDAMSVEIAGGNAPDIVGPVGVSGAEAFHGQWLDLHRPDRVDRLRPEPVQPRARSTSTTSAARARSACRSPSTRRCCTTSATCSTRPASSTRRTRTVTRTSSTARRSTWDFDTLRELAKRLTVDEAGNDATSPDFDPETDRAVGLRAAVPGPPRRRARTSAPAAWSPMTAPPHRSRSTGATPGSGSTRRIWTDHVDHDRGARDAPEFGQRQRLPLGQGRDGAHAPVVHVLRIGRRGRRRRPDWDIAAVPAYNGTADLELQRGHLPDLGRHRASGGGVRGPDLPPR